MARYAILSDIHANLEALEAVLAHAAGKQVNDIWFLGDVVMYGPNPNECIVRLREAIGVDKWPGTAVVGNNDQALVKNVKPEEVSEQLGIKLTDKAMVYRNATTVCHRWTAKALTDESRQLLAQVGPGPRNVLANGILVHASPCEATGMNGDYLTNLMEAEEGFWCLRQRGNDLAFFGHTHMATLFKETRTDRRYQNCEMVRREQLTGLEFPLDGQRMLINPGSVGQPRDGDSRAAYAILDEGSGLVRFHRVDYLRQRTLQKLAQMEDEFAQEWAQMKRESKDKGEGMPVTAKQIVEALQSRLIDAR